MVVPKKYRVDLNRHPGLLCSPLKADEQITIGDMHANPIKMVLFLVSHGVIELSPSNYERLNQLYNESEHELSPDKFQLFREVLFTARTNNRVGMVRFIGDMVSDRGHNDAFIIAILELLNRGKVPCEIIFSNHDFNFILNYEKGKFQADLRSPLDEDICSHQAISMLNFRELLRAMRRNLSFKKASKSMDAYIRANYIKHVKLFSYSLAEDRSSIQIFSHAPINFRVIELAAAEFGVAIPADIKTSAESMARLIDRINERFKHLLETKKLSKHIDAHGGEDNILYQAIWNRRFFAKDSGFAYDIDNVFGHVSEKYQHEGNLDSDLGKAPHLNVGNLTVHTTTGVMELSKQEQAADADAMALEYSAGLAGSRRRSSSASMMTRLSTDLVPENENGDVEEASAHQFKPSPIPNGILVELEKMERKVVDLENRGYTQASAAMRAITTSLRELSEDVFSKETDEQLRLKHEYLRGCRAVVAQHTDTLSAHREIAKVYIANFFLAAISGFVIYGVVAAATMKSRGNNFMFFNTPDSVEKIDGAMNEIDNTCQRLTARAA